MNDNLTDALAPIALFAYNRPQHLAQTVSALLRDPLGSASDLYIFCDGPKTTASEAAVREVRSFARSITGFASISVVEQEHNRGLANSIIAGVTTLCERFERVIVIEDDLVVAPCFLRFMNFGLRKYEANEQVMQVAGHTFPIDRSFAKSALFLPLTTSLGWATWRRAWHHFDPAMSGHAALQRSWKLRRQFDLDGAYEYFSLLERQRRGEADSWAIRWYLSCFMRHSLTLYPGTTLVHHIGYDGSGTHAGNVAPTFELRPLPDARHTFSFPSTIEINTRAFAQVRRTLRGMYPRPGLLARIKRLRR